MGDCAESCVDGFDVDVTVSLFVYFGWFMFCHDFRHSYMVINSYMVITINSL